LHQLLCIRHKRNVVLNDYDHLVHYGTDRICDSETFVSKDDLPRQRVIELLKARRKSDVPD
jgi:hypothetical protein